VKCCDRYQRVLIVGHRYEPITFALGRRKITHHLASHTDRSARNHEIFLRHKTHLSVTSLQKQTILIRASDGKLDSLYAQTDQSLFQSTEVNYATLRRRVIERGNKES